ncbi:MAG: cell division protein FtsZ [Candidatus Micrarchaeota archaeon]|nr:cell division protein FtsZ [Candidatus Micrarchaeota archaeon]
MFGEADGQKAEDSDGLMSNEKVRIGVIGVGGAGCNTVDRMMKNGIKSAQTIAVNTDQLHLKMVQAHKRVLIGSTITKGLGAGGFPEVAAKCAEMSRDKLKEVIGEKELVFISAGMGGGTGTGAAPVIAEIAKEQGAIVVSIVTVPFRLERARMVKAKWGLERLAAKSDTIIVIENDRLVSYVPNLPINEAFNLADAITGKAITGIADTIMFPSLMNIDFADVRSVMENGGFALISMGEGSGQDRVENVVKSTMEHPLLDVSYEGAKGALLHITGGAGLTLGESIEIGERISASFDLNADVKMGARLDPSMGNTITCTAIITGVKSPYNLDKKEETAQRSVIEIDNLSSL